MTSDAIRELQRGVRRDLIEVGEEKMQTQSDFALTLLPRPQISHKSSENIAQARWNAPCRSGFAGFEAR